MVPLGPTVGTLVGLAAFKYKGISPLLLFSVFPKGGLRTGDRHRLMFSTPGSDLASGVTSYSSYDSIVAFFRMVELEAGDQGTVGGDCVDQTRKRLIRTLFLGF